MSDAGSSPSGAGRGRRAAFDDEVRLGGKGADAGPPLGGGDVEDDAPLVGAEVEEETALLGVRDVAGEGARPPQGMPARRFHEEHLGAEVGEQAGAVRPGDAVAEVENANAGKGFFRHGLLSLGKP